MIATYQELPELRREAPGMPIYFKAGSFDLLHEGHLKILGYLRSLGGISVVGLSPDSRIRQRKGSSRPIRNSELRLLDIDETGLVDYEFVMPDGLLGVARSVIKLRPDAFVEHLSDSFNVPITTALLKLAGVNYILSGENRICSTTEIIENRAFHRVKIPNFGTFTAAAPVNEWNVL